VEKRLVERILKFQSEDPPHVFKLVTTGQSRLYVKAVKFGGSCKFGVVERLFCSVGFRRHLVHFISYSIA